MTRKQFSMGALALAGLLLADAAEATAGGFREQLGWQFRSPAESTVRLNKEAQRLKANGLDGLGAGTAIGLGGLSGAGSGGPLTSGNTIGNSTSATTNYTINLDGSLNEIVIDGYLNLDTSQTNDNQSSEVNSEMGE